MTHKEPGLMKVCWVGGQANYAGDCIELKWDKKQFPLTYYIDFGKDHEDYIDSVVKGAEMWNREICTVFRRVMKSEDARIMVTWGAVSTGHSCSAGATSHVGKSGPTGATIVLREPSDIHAVYRYAAHEFGHVLGLDHDAFSKSIMYPLQPGVTEEMTFVLPSDSDRKLLKELYCK
jgi:hypothetical protein